MALLAYPAWANAPALQTDNTASTSAYVVPTYVLPSVSPIIKSLPRPQTAPPSDFTKTLEEYATEEEKTVLTRIAYCESHWQMKWNWMHEKNPDYYTAYGYFQITRGTAIGTDQSLDRMDPRQNVQLAVKLYRKRGLSPWSESASCWNQKAHQ